MAGGDVGEAQAIMGRHLRHIEEKPDMDDERSPGNLYAAFAYVERKAG